MIGIYGIKNKINGKIYIGQSVNVEGRFVRHRYELNKNIHRNSHLQRAWLKHGESNFEFIILTKCEKTQLDIMEEHQANQIPKIMLYNINNNFTSCRGEKNPFFGRTHNEESKNKMSKWKKEHYLKDNNPNYGKKQPVTVRIKIATNNSHTKLTVKNVLKIVELLKEGHSHQEIANKFNIARTAITRISNGTRWTNITGGAVFPVIYENGNRKLSESHKEKIGKSHKGMKYKRRK